MVERQATSTDKNGQGDQYVGSICPIRAWAVRGLHRQWCRCPLQPRFCILDMTPTFSLHQQNAGIGECSIVKPGPAVKGLESRDRAPKILEKGNVPPRFETQKHKVPDLIQADECGIQVVSK